MNADKSPAISPLEKAIATVAAERHDDAVTLADFATSFAHDMKRGQQIDVLARLSQLDRRVYRLISQLCDITDANRDQKRAT